jgi:flavin-dependent dehydrogenase
MDDKFTAVVVGGGPAGASAAITLARLGHRTLVIDDSTGAFKIGEALVPAVRSLLRNLGVMERFLADCHLPCYGNVSAWGGEETHPTDFVFNPHGHGWHLDRLRFDAMLRDAARDGGARLSPGTKLVGIERDIGGWQAMLKTDDAPQKVHADWLVDATGRRSAVARRMGAKRVQEDSLVAFYAVFGRTESTGRDQDSRTFVEAAPDGWWYTALVPSGERVVAFLTDSDLADRASLQSEAGFIRHLEKTRHVGLLISELGYRPRGCPRGTDASTARLDHFGGSGWLAIGDAAISFDPLSSQGVLNALYTGVKAGQAVGASLAGDFGLVDKYLEQLGSIYTAYLTNRATYYASERRWAERPFWHRRSPMTSSEITPPLSASCP